jgi:hypothetical protein
MAVNAIIKRMNRIPLFSLLILHGLIHLMGFVKEFRLGLESQLNGKKVFAIIGNCQKVAGSLWFLAFALFVSAAVLYIMRKDWFWIPALVALVISQTLVVIYWQDAKFGTAANLIILIVLLLAIGKFQFDARFKTISERLSSNSFDRHIVITDEKIQRLPQNVQRWMRRSNVVGKTHSNIVRVFQKGTMRLKPDAEWMPFEAEEIFTVDPPSFIWKADIRMNSLITIGGMDKYENGEGNMLIKPLFVYTLANATGKEINQGTLLRYLGEMAWFPHVATSSYLNWEQINSDQARVTMSYQGVTASGVFTFNEEGLPLKFEAQRYGDFNGEYRIENWSVAVTNYKVFDGKKIGNVNEVTWKLKTGDFLWLKMEVTDIRNE